MCRVRGGVGNKRERVNWRRGERKGKWVRWRAGGERENER